MKIESGTDVRRMYADIVKLYGLKHTPGCYQRNASLGGPIEFIMTMENVDADLEILMPEGNMVQIIRCEDLGDLIKKTISGSKEKWRLKLKGRNVFSNPIRFWNYIRYPFDEESRNVAWNEMFTMLNFLGMEMIAKLKEGEKTMDISKKCAWEGTKVCDLCGQCAWDRAHNIKWCGVRYERSRD